MRPGGGSGPGEGGSGVRPAGLCASGELGPLAIALFLRIGGGGLVEGSAKATGSAVRLKKLMGMQKAHCSRNCNWA